MVDLVTGGSRDRNETETGGHRESVGRVVV